MHCFKPLNVYANNDFHNLFLQKMDPKYLKSKEIQKKLKITSCELMHLRVEGKLNFIKKGNAFFYENVSDNITDD